MMNTDGTSAKTYYVQEFARMAGVTVRTLHFYDQAGLLRPGRKGSVRLYGQGDMLRLQQILTLKFLGFSLEEIRELLNSPAYSVKEALRIQKQAVDRQIEELNKVSRALELSLAHLENTGLVDWAQISAIITAIQATGHQHEWVRQYFTDAQLAEVMAHSSMEEALAGVESWKALAEAYRAHCHLPPDHPDVQKLAAQQHRLVSQFTGGNPEIEERLKVMYNQDFDQIPAEYRLYDSDLQQFINRAYDLYRRTINEI